MHDFFWYLLAFVVADMIWDRVKGGFKKLDKITHPEKNEYPYHFICLRPRCGFDVRGNDENAVMQIRTHHEQYHARKGTTL